MCSRSNLSLLVLLCFLGSQTVFGQNNCRKLFYNQGPQVGVSYNTENGIDLAMSGDGNLLVLGHAYISDTRWHDITLTKLSPQGNQIWNKNYGFNPFNQTYPSSEYAESIVQVTSGNGQIILGITRVLGQADVLLFRTGGNGNVLWSKIIGGNGSDSPGEVIAISDGNYLFTGDWDLPSSAETNGLVTKFTAAGNLVWQTAIHAGQGVTLRLKAVTELPTGEFVVVGSTPDDLYVGKLAADGTLLQSYGLDFATNAVGVVDPELKGIDVLPGPAGSVLVLAEVDRGILGDEWTALVELFPDGSNDITLLEGDDQAPKELIAISNGEYAIVGANHDMEVGYLMRFDGNVDYIGTQAYGISSGIVYLNAIQEVPNGDLMLLGDISYGNATYIPEGDQVLIRASPVGTSSCCGMGNILMTERNDPLVRTDFGGAILPQLTVSTIPQPYMQNANAGLFPLCVTKTGSQDISANDLDIAGIEVFPNPANEQVQIRWSEEKELQVLQLLDMTGKMVQEIRPDTTSELSINLSQLPSGIYLIRANISGEWHQKKLTIAHQ